jgi:predicted HicB family RNase H-like nuclease
MIENISAKMSVMIMKNQKQFPLRIDSELYKKLKIKATIKDVSVNEYIISLISDNVNDVDLSAILNE